MIWSAALALAAGGPAHAADPQPDGVEPGLTVSVVKAERRCRTDAIRSTGTLVPRTEIEVRAERGGLLVSYVLVEPGDGVRAGQVLARLVQPAGAPPQGFSVRSPADGILVGVAADVGGSASSDAGDPMFRIVVDGALEFEGEVPASTVSHVRVGAPATLRVTGIGQVTGRVETLDGKVDPRTQLGTVRITVPTDPRSRPGLHAVADIEGEASCDVRVPVSAILYGPEGPALQVVRGARVGTRAIKVGPSGKGWVRIEDGLAQDEVVVSKAGTFLKDGDPVRPVFQGDEPPF